MHTRLSGSKQVQHWIVWKNWRNKMKWLFKFCLSVQVLWYFEYFDIVKLPLKFLTLWQVHLFNSIKQPHYTLFYFVFMRRLAIWRTFTPIQLNCSTRVSWEGDPQLPCIFFNGLKAVVWTPVLGIVSLQMTVLKLSVTLLSRLNHGGWKS